MSIFRPPWHQKSIQNRQKIDPKINQKNDTILIRIFIDFWSIWTNFGRPRGGPRRVHEPTFGGIFGSWSQDGTQTLPSRPQDPILDDFYRFLMIFYRILIHFLLDFLSIFGRFLIDLTNIFVKFFVDSLSIFDQLSSFKLLM